MNRNERTLFGLIFFITIVIIITIFGYKEPWKYKVGECFIEEKSIFRIEKLNITTKEYSIRYSWGVRWSPDTFEFSKSYIEANNNFLSIQCPIVKEEK